MIPGPIGFGRWARMIIQGSDVELTEYFVAFARRLSRRVLRAHLRYAVVTPANDNRAGAVA